MKSERLKVRQAGFGTGLTYEEENIRIAYRKVPTYNKEKKIASHNLGSNTTFFYYDDNFNLITRHENNDESFIKDRYLWGKLLDTSSKISKYDSTMGIILQNINPELINPFTILRMTAYDYPEIQGDYAILENSFIFSSSDNKHYKNAISLKLIKK